MLEDYSSERIRQLLLFMTITTTAHTLDTLLGCHCPARAQLPHVGRDARRCPLRSHITTHQPDLAVRFTR
jgi:hypothetical protein